MADPLPLDLGVKIRHPRSGAQGDVIDVYDDGGWIRGEYRTWPVYVVQFPGFSEGRTARRWAKDGFEVVPQS